MKSKKTLFLRPMHEKHVQAPTDMRMNCHPQKIMNRYFKTSPGKYPGATALWGLLLLLTVGFALPIQAQFTVQPTSSGGISARVITAESCTGAGITANTVIDPGETVTVQFQFKNTSGSDKANVKATLLAQGNVTFPVTAGQTFPYGSGQVTIGNMAKDAVQTVSFQFRAEGTCGAFLTPTLRIVADGGVSQDLSFAAFELGARNTTNYPFTNGTDITIPDSGSTTGRATPYPSPITVSGVPNASTVTGERVSKVTVAINGLTHDFTQDLQILLVGPQGQTVMLMNDAGAQTSPFGVSGVNLTFDQAATGQLPQTTTITSGSYRPSNFGPNDTMPAPASGSVPAGPYGSSLDVFGTSTRTSSFADPNGTWNLFVSDDTAGGTGVIDSWSITVQTIKIDCCDGGQTDPNVAVTSVTAINEDSTGSNTTQNIATFTVNDIEGGVVALTLASSNTSLVTSANLEVVEGNPTVTAGTPVTRTVRVKGDGLVANANGTSVITITATDPQGNVSTSLFTLTVNSVNDLPTITAIPNQSANVGTPTGQLPFTIGDVETADLTTLILVPSSSDQSVVPSGNIFLAGADDGTPATRTVQVFPASSTTSGTATVTITVRDSNNGETSTSFVVAFNVQPGFPTITPISAQSMDEDAAAKTVSFTVAAGSGSSTQAGSLSVGASSSNTTLVPSGNIVITQPTGTGSSSSASVAITPAANQNGSTTITLTVTDPMGAGDADNRTTTTTFVLTVNSINDLPTITTILDQNINEDTSTAALTFTIGDVENGTALTLSASSSDASIIPSAIVNDVNLPGVTFGGSGASRTVSVKPAADAFGAAAVTVTVTDANGGSASSTFRVTVAALNDPPAVTQAGISGGTLVNLANNATDAPVAITIGEDAGTFTVALAGVLPGPANEDPDQTVSLRVTVETATDTRAAEIRLNDSGTITWGTERLFDNVGTSPTFVMRTISNRTADTVVRLLLRDNLTAETTRKFTIRITTANDTPTIAAIADRPNEQSGAGLSVPISVADNDPGSTLTVTATSSNQAVVRDSNMFAVSNNQILSILTEATPGTTTITVTVTDQTGLSASRSFVLTTSNIAPPAVSISPSSATIDEDTITSATITGSGQGALTFTKNSGNTTLVPNDNIIISGSGNTRTLVIVPAADQPPGAPGTSATAAISVTVTDERGASATATFSLTVRAIPDNPTLTFLGALASGSVTVSEGGVASEDTSTDSDKYEIRYSDPEDGTSPTLTVTSSNTALIPSGPIFTSGTSATTTGSPAVAVGPGVAVGTPTANGTRQIAFRPVPDQLGTATLTFTVSDSSGRVATSTINLNVVSQNDPPTLSPLISDLTLAEDFGTSTIVLNGITAGPSNESAQTLTVSIVSIKEAGTDTASDKVTASVTPNVSSTGTATLTLTSVANKNGAVDIKVRIADNGGTANGGVDIFEDTFTLTITSINDQPSLAFSSTTATIIQSGGSAGFTVVPFTVGDVETSAFSLAVSGLSDNVGVVISPTAADFGGSGTDRSVRLTANNSTVTGTANVTITVNDGSGSANATRSQVLAVTVRVPSQNPEITISPTQVTVAPNTESQVITLTLADFQQSASQLAVTYTSDNQAMIPNGSQTVGAGQNGGTSSVVFSGTGTATRLVIVRPSTFGTANLTFTVHDNIGGSPDNTGTATLRVISSTPPTVTPDQTTVNLAQNAGATTVGVTVADPNETPAGFLTLTATSNNQTVIPNANISVTAGSSNSRRNVTFTPVANQTGNVVITLTVTDGDGLTGTATINVNVANTAPTITGPFTTTIAANSSATLTYTVADTETAAGSLGTLGVTAATSNATLIPVANIGIVASGATRTVTITPAANQSGSATITFTVTDAQGATGTATLLVTVSNAAPTITPPAAQTIAESSSTGSLSFSVADSDGAVSGITVAGTSSNTTLVPVSGISIPASTGATRTVVITPAAGQSGTATITLTATDAAGATGTATFLVTVVGNAPPTITGLPSALTVQLNQSATVTYTVSDAETPAASVQTTYTSSNSALVNAATGIQQATATSGSRTIVITPTAGQSGTTTITVTATDGGNKTAQGSFTLTVSSNTAPTITSLTNQTVNKNTSTSAQSFNINDTETPTSLTVSASSSNTTLVPAGNIAISGTGNTRTVVVTPANNQVGSATVTVTVADGGGLTASSNFTVTVLQTAPVKGDMDGDGRSDILFQDADGFLAVWLMNGRDLTSAGFLLPSNLGDTNYRIAGTGDFNRDGQEDIIFQHNDGTMAVWFMSGTSQASAQVLTPSSTGDANWKIVAVADMDADQNADLLFQHTDGSLAVWFMNGVTQRSASLLSPSNPGNNAWRVVGVGDFNADGKQDLAFQHTDGTLAVWYMNGIAMTQPTFLTPNHPGAGWRVVGVADRNADGRADLLFQHTDYSLATWSLNGVTLTTAQLLNPSNSGATWRALAPK
jgi:subtilisin-like proprotein convertase family protein